MNNIFFTADLHFGHKNILQHVPSRPYSTDLDISKHDEWLMELWCSQICKKDIVYIIGDLTFYRSGEARKLLEKLPGVKFLITGNHDHSVKAHKEHFEKVAQILDISIKPANFPELQETMLLTLCHYPMLDWNNRNLGSIMLHGHCHGKLDRYNHESGKLRFDVGIDGELAHKSGGFVSLTALYEAALQKTAGEPFSRYAQNRDSITDIFRQ
ncbi:MAG: hypothetical protein NC308_10005 [Clostridium sp.]|nr:hypothetical protein [Bacteroides sp.]MCM1199208.1 hypothetical protein [Clostridium sp.]